MTAYPVSTSVIAWHNAGYFELPKMRISRDQQADHPASQCLPAFLAAAASLAILSTFLATSNALAIAVHASATN